MAVVCCASRSKKGFRGGQYSFECGDAKSFREWLVCAGTFGLTTRILADLYAFGVMAYELAAGQNLYFPANDRVEVTANHASALLLELNGQKVMPARIPGSSSTISLTRKI